MEKFKIVIKKAFKRNYIDALSAMALGLFASLIIGLILSQFSKIPGLAAGAILGPLSTTVFFYEE